MNGLHYHRLTARLTLKQLAELSHYSWGVLQKLDRRISPSTPSAVIANLAAALGVTMDELLRTYPDDALSAGDHPAYPPRARQRGNLLERYRRANNLTCEELAQRLGVGSRQAAQQACVSPKPSKKHLRRLAELEGVTTEEFIYRYQERKS